MILQEPNHLHLRQFHPWVRPTGVLQHCTPHLAEGVAYIGTQYIFGYWLKERKIEGREGRREGEEERKVN